jgi:sortase A
VPNGSALGFIKIPSIDVDWAFVEGVKARDIEKGPGHFRESPMPGQIGNTAIAGHRTTHGQPFFDLDKVQPGDEIITITDTGTHVYEITESLVVSPTDYAEVVPPFMADTATLTLVTCTPVYTARDRLVVRAVIVPEKSDQLFLPPSKLPEPDPGVGGPDDTVAPGTTVPGGAVIPDCCSTPAIDPADDAFADDTAFSGGWFDDMAAIPQIIGWGLILVAIVMGAYLLGRHFRRLTVSVVAGVVPFVVALYFWYENIYRLLPPGL